MEEARQLMRMRHMSIRTEEAYLRWIEKFLRFHKLQRLFHLRRLLWSRHISVSRKSVYPELGNKRTQQPSLTTPRRRPNIVFPGNA
ncbi:MAG: phage integrase N-terminal SAM-like domain-containing protein [Planctomycetota bacterium]